MLAVYLDSVFLQYQKYTVESTDDWNMVLRWKTTVEIYRSRGKSLHEKIPHSVSVKR